MPGSDLSHIEIVSDEMVEILRMKTPQERLGMTHAMWRAARKRLYFSIREMHSDWSHDMVKREVAKRMLGKDFPE